MVTSEKNFDLTPDRIRYALGQVHTTIFEDQSTKKEAQMQSRLCSDAEKIFQILGISTERVTAAKTECFA